MTEAQVVADRLVAGLIAWILPGNQVLRDHVVIAALSGAEYRVQHAADQFDPADDQPVDVFPVEEPGE